jgi:hypothetical protein
MNKITLTFLGLVSVLQISCGAEGPPVTIKATVFDEAGEFVEGAEVKGGFHGSKPEGGALVSAFTDEIGVASVSGNTLYSVRVLAEKEGYYQSKIDKVPIGSMSEVITPRNRSISLKLRQTKNATPLIARVVDIEIPIKDQWAGFDFEVSDWVDPYGAGKKSDVLVRYTNVFLGLSISEEGREKVKARRERTGQEWTDEMEKHTYGKWSGEVEIKFLGEDEGIIKVVDEYIRESEMKMPHLAPEEGYLSEASWVGSIPEKNLDLFQGYFLRLRVKKRGDEIIQANYAKINEQVKFDPRGKLRLVYYYNPEVNDQNLEFDINRNLLGRLPHMERVRLP